MELTLHKDLYFRGLLPEIPRGFACTKTSAGDVVSLGVDFTQSSTLGVSFLDVSPAPRLLLVSLGLTLHKDLYFGGRLPEIPRGIACTKTSAWGG